MMQRPWWRGARGEWYVVVQLVLIAVVFFGPRQLGGWPRRPFPLPGVSLALGAALVLVGTVMFLTGIVALGSSLTPLPHPRESATLIRSGPYRFVRHPIYGGGIALAFGWAFLVQSWLTVVYALVLLAFLDVKSRREERWLVEKFPDYEGYRRRVRKLVPFVY